MPSLEYVNGRIKSLKNRHSALKPVWDNRKRLRRGLLKNSTTEKLRTNDSVTLFDFALHLLSSRDLRWQTPHVTDPDQMTKNGIVERVLESILYQNNIARSQRGLQRVERTAAASALEQAKTVIYKERRGDTFRIDPVDPNSVYERFDDRGLVELVHEFVVSADYVNSRLNNSEISGWSLPNEHSSIDGQVLIHDYWERSIVTDDWNHVIVIGPKGSRFGVVGNSLKEPIEVFQVNDLPSHPWDVQYYSGEEFFGEDNAYKGRSIFDANSRIYDDYHRFLEDLHTHIKEVLTAPANAGTAGARPIDPSYVDPHKGDRPIYNFDPTRGESALSFSQIGPLDSSTQLIDNAFQQFIQAGGISKIFLGNLNFQLSGYAISELEELTLSSVGEVAVGLEFMWSRIGNWVLTELRDNPPTAPQEFSGFTASLSNRGFFSDTFSFPRDLPKNIAVAAKLDIAMPSDLTERMNLARMADPTSGPIWGRTAVGTLFHREVPDWQDNIDEIKAQNTQQLPQIQLLEVYAGLRIREKELEDSSNRDDQFRLEVVREEIESIKTILQGSQVQNQAQPQGSVNPQQQVQPAEARGQGRQR